MATTKCARRPEARARLKNLNNTIRIAPNGLLSATLRESEQANLRFKLCRFAGRGQCGFGARCSAPKPEPAKDSKGRSADRVLGEVEKPRFNHCSAHKITIKQFISVHIIAQFLSQRIVAR